MKIINLVGLALRNLRPDAKSKISYLKIPNYIVILAAVILKIIFKKRSAYKSVIYKLTDFSLCEDSDFFEVDDHLIDAYQLDFNNIGGWEKLKTDVDSPSFGVWVNGLLDKIIIYNKGGFQLLSFFNEKCFNGFCF